MRHVHLPEGVSRWFTPSACGPGAPEVPKSNSDVAGKKITLFTVTCLPVCMPLSGSCLSHNGTFGSRCVLVVPKTSDVIDAPSAWTETSNTRVLRFNVEAVMSLNHYIMTATESGQYRRYRDIVCKCNNCHKHVRSRFPAGQPSLIARACVRAPANASVLFSIASNTQAPGLWPGLHASLVTFRTGLCAVRATRRCKLAGGGHRCIHVRPFPPHTRRLNTAAAPMHAPVVQIRGDGALCEADITATVEANTVPPAPTPTIAALIPPFPPSPVATPTFQSSRMFSFTSQGTLESSAVPPLPDGPNGTSIQANVSTSASSNVTTTVNPG